MNTTRRRLGPEVFAGIELIDHHCHGVVEQPLQRSEFEDMITESNWPAPPGTSFFDSQVGVAIRRWCAPALGLEASAPPEEYLQRRAELGAAEVNRLLLTGTGITRYLIETGHKGDVILEPEAMAARADAGADVVVRLERIAEQVIEAGIPDGGFADAFRTELASQLRGAVGVKSIAAYRVGLDFAAARPDDAEVNTAAARIEQSGGQIRVADPVLIRFGIWCAVDAQQPIQFHVGYGDPDVDLHRCNPLLMTDFLRATRTSGARILLLHCYPYHREAGYLAHSFPHVFFDVGLAINYVGARARQVIAESLELAPFDRVLFSSDAWGLSELYFLGAELFRDGVLHTINEWIDADQWTAADGERLIRKMCGENARYAYRLPDAPRYPVGKE